MNWPLFSVIYLISGTVTIGIFIIGTLLMGFNQITHLQMAILLGVLLSIPITMFFAKKVGSITGNEEGHVPLN